MSPSFPVRLLLVDDHEMVRSALRRLLESRSDMVVVGEAASASKGRELVDRMKPDVAVFDLDFSDEPALATLLLLIRKSRLSGSGLPLVCSYRARPGETGLLIEAGLRGYVTKSSPVEELIEAIRAVHEGDSYYCRRSAAAFEQHRKSRQRAYGTLSPRQFSVLMLVAQGHSTSTISSMLSLTSKTVENYRGAILKRLHAKNLTHAVSLARHIGLLDV